MEDARAHLAIPKPLRDAARKARKLVYPVPFKEQELYLEKISEVEEKLKGAPSPCMPIISTKIGASIIEVVGSRRVHLDNAGTDKVTQLENLLAHRDRISDAYALDAYHALVHKQLQTRRMEAYTGSS